MRITRLEVFSFPVPFKVVFRHASASRSKADNLIVAVQSDCGKVGYGEGCPRSYVTGETVETGRAFIGKHRDEICGAVASAQDLRAWIDSHRTEIDDNPSAFCAVEIAILDLLGKVTGCSTEEVLDSAPLEGAFQYSAILGDAPFLAYRWQLGRYWRRGFRDFKIKVSGDLQRDRRKISALKRKADPALRIRVDANNLWTSAEACSRHIADLGYRIFAVEEPLQPRDLDGFRLVSENCSAKIILDESVTRRDDLVGLEDPERWIVNIRVSKMGGVIRSLDIAQRAMQAGIGIVVGAQVGETSILTRSALTVMNAARPSLVGSEGAFGTHLLKEDLASPCLMFGSGGNIDTDKLNLREKPGQGLEIRDDLLV